MINRIGWGEGRQLVGNGPGYLLVSPKETLDLRTGVAPELGKLLKGFEVFKDGELDPLVYHLSRIYGGLNFGGISVSQDYVLCAIAGIHGRPDTEVDETARDFTSKLKAAVRLREWSRIKKAVLRWEPCTCKLWTETAANSVPISVTDSDYGFQGGPASLIYYRWKQYLVLCDLVGNREPTREELFKHIEPISFAIRTKEDSVFAQVATDLGGLPTKKDIREALCVGAQTITRLCGELGFDWLPEAEGGRPKIVI